MDIVTLDELDRGLVQALQADGRASFARIGEVLGASDRTVARRFARLREARVLHVVGLVEPTALDGDRWVVRMQCRPGTALQVADALSRRDDTRWVTLLSGGTEIGASLQSWSVRERDELILQRLHRTASVVSVSAHSVLHEFAQDGHAFEVPGPLTPEQIASLAPEPGDGEPVTLAETDRPLFDALAVDGRAPYPVLAAATGWSESTVARRLHTLRAAGLLHLDVDIDIARLGHRAGARLWASVAPADLAATGAAVAAHPEAFFVAATTGPTNLFVSVTCRDNQSLFRYLTERLGALPAVHAVQTAPVMRIIKRAGRLPL
ncbi:Lrp/AsnC family transcriptional regulator [Catenuloplanes japonicus]|uniref:Lrp/AsnC family transcriptional regulator n=1 Tax=Catenuloplanes japonicus TaxID=33876 RepID=UPI000527F06C|nr:Lrp/AsnC family transcriptional regulator [Catenuloplanes japonicus]